MQQPLEITFRGMDRSAAVEATVQRWMDRLERTYPRMVRGSVVIELPHRHSRHGQAFHVGIDITIPERTISVSRDPGLDAAHDDVYVAIADAFRAARRQLADHAHIVRGEVKLHA